MASSEARNLVVHASQWAMNPRLGIAAGDEQIQRQLVTTLASAPAANVEDFESFIFFEHAVVKSGC